jgi:Ala-tRNA(Pro) deacylase
MITSRLKQLLEQNGVRYHSIPHLTAYRADRTALAAGLPSEEFAKTVLVKADGRLCMVVLPADQQVQLETLRQQLGARTLELAGELEVGQAFPDCETGAMPPFGRLYGMEVFVSPALRRDEQIAFNAGSHDEAVRMSYRDYERLAQPRRLQM